MEREREKIIDGKWRDGEKEKERGGRRGKERESERESESLVTPNYFVDQKLRS